MYKQIIPAQDWFFLTYDPDQRTLSIFCLAAWGLTEEGIVIGLVSVSNSQRHDTDNKCARLVTVPPITGYYKCKDELTELESRVIKQGGYLKGVSEEQWKEGVSA